MSHPPVRISVDLTDAEIRVLRNLVDAAFDREEDALSRVVGTHHHQIKTAHRVREKVLRALDHHGRVDKKPRSLTVAKSNQRRNDLTEETPTLHDRIRRGEFTTKLPYPDRRDPNFTDLRRRYHEDEGRMVEKFKNAVFEEYGVTNNPKRELCWQKAWEHGHSAGLSEVNTYFQDFVELIQ